MKNYLHLRIDNFKFKFIMKNYLFLIAATAILFWNCNSDRDLLQNQEDTIVQSEKKSHLESGKSKILDPDYLSNLRAYKKSKHQLMAGYYRVWSDKAAYADGFTTMTQLPDKLDIVIIFSAYAKPSNPFWKTLKEKYIPYLHDRGTKVVFSRDVSHLYSKLERHDEQAYQERANQLINIVNEYNFDGLDFDIEGYYNSTQKQDIIGVMKALSSKLGPLSGTDKLLIYDTNKSGWSSLFQSVHTYISYVFLQVYGGRETERLDISYSTYSNYIRSDQFVPGFSFYEERGLNWGDLNYDKDKKLTGTGTAYKYAKWQPKSGGKKGGIFAYAIDRDIPYITDEKVSPNYAVTKRLINIMNPPK